MSDMEQSDVVAPAADAAPTAEPVAPAAPAPSAQELQAEIDAEKTQLAQLQAAVDAQNQASAPPAIVPVQQQAPSSASPTQQPESTPVADEAPLSLEDAVRALLIFVKGRRTVGDSDLDAALADVEAALPAQDVQA